MYQTHTLYQRYKALRTDENGELTQTVSNNPVLVAAYRKALKEYRDFVDCPLEEILRTLSNEFTEDYCDEMRNK